MGEPNCLGHLGWTKEMSSERSATSVQNQHLYSDQSRRFLITMLLGVILGSGALAIVSQAHAEETADGVGYAAEDRARLLGSTQDQWTARLLDVRVDQHNGQPVVKLKTTARVASAISYLKNPDRLLMKVRHTLLTWKPTTLLVRHPPLERIRAAQHDDDVWVVLDMTRPARWHRQTQAYGLVLTLGPQATGPALDTTRPTNQTLRGKTVRAGQAQVRYQVVDVGVDNLGDKTKLIITTDGQARYKVERRKNGQEVVVTLVEAALAWHGRISGLPAGAIRTLHTQAQPKNGMVTVAVGLTQPATYVVYKDQNQVVLEFNNPQAIAQEAPRQGNLRALISVDLENAPLVSVLRALAQEVKFDLILSPGVQQVSREESALTLSINQQPFEQVLDFILRPRKMAFAVNNNTLRIGLAGEFMPETKIFVLKNMDVANANIKESIETAFTEGARDKVVVDSYGNRVIVSAIPSDLVRISKIIGHMDVQRRLVSQTFLLNYVDAAKIAPLLKSQLSSLGAVKENKSENALVVTDIPGNMESLRRIIRNLDTKAQQVMIEARIVEVSHTNQLDLGVDWNVASAAGANPNYTVASSPQPVGQVGSLTIGSLQSGVDLNATLSAMETKGMVNTISNPRIATINKEEATLKASQSIPYITSVVSNGVVSQMVDYLELPIVLKVTPQVTKGNQVLLNPLSLTVTTPVGTGNPPTTTTRSASTQMLVHDGQTIAIGGMVRDDEITTESKVPLLGDLPVLGFLFKSNVTKKNKVELVVFLTTHILE